MQEQKVQENIAHWQSGSSPLSALSDGQLDIIYQIKDCVEQNFSDVTKVLS